MGERTSSSKEESAEFSRKPVRTRGQRLNAARVLARALTPVRVPVLMSQEPSILPLKHFSLGELSCIITGQIDKCRCGTYNSTHIINGENSVQGGEIVVRREGFACEGNSGRGERAHSVDARRLS